MPGMHPEGLGVKSSPDPSLGDGDRAERSGEGVASVAVSPSAVEPAISASFFARVFALQDIILLSYLTIVAALLWRVGASSVDNPGARAIYGAMIVLVAGCIIGRGLPDVHWLVRAVSYRIAIIGVVLYNYLVLRHILPVVRPDSLDEELFAIDKALFGVEPSIWMERFNQRPIIEWFSFFYFSYFFICGLSIIVCLGLDRIGRRTTEYALGTALLYSIGQIGYMCVPGYGPIRYLTPHFQGPLNGGFWWGCVWKTVEAGSAMKDIFPSLHTAAPLWFALHFMRRAKDDPRWKWPSRVALFFSMNIIISTILLRWHYAIDVVAGFTLSLSVTYVVPKIAAWEEERRARWGSRGVWFLP